jgi:hypothetical protein
MEIAADHATLTEEEKVALDAESERMVKMLLDDVDKADEMKKKEEEKENIPPSLCTVEPEGIYPMPLIDHLCKRYKCSLKELQVLMQGLETRREIIRHMRNDLQLRTSHIRPAERNFIVRCGDLTAQSVGTVLALGGYLGVTVRDERFETGKLFSYSGACLLLLPPQPPFAPSLLALHDRIWWRTASLILSA